jgi:hypothetical protein
MERKKCSLKWDIQLHDAVGRGGHRTVYRTCQTGTGTDSGTGSENCLYVAKIGRVRTEKDLANVENEYKVGTKLFRLGGGPQVYDVFFCDLDFKQSDMSFWSFLNPKSFQEKDEKKFLSLIDQEPFWDSNLCKTNKCTFSILITAYINGITARQFIKLHKQEREIWLRVLLFVKEMFENGLVVTDPNYDNFLIEEKTGKLMLVDAEHVYPIGSELLKQQEEYLNYVFDPVDKVLNYANFVMKNV